MVTANIFHAYRQLPLDSVDWQLISFMEGGRFFTDVSLPFSKRLAASSCQDTTAIVAQHLNKLVVCVLTLFGYMRPSPIPSRVQLQGIWLGLGTRLE